jgi:hypothetical protein
MHKENKWETYNNVVDNNAGMLKEYYEKNPAREKDGRFMEVWKRKRKTRKKSCNDFF